MGWDVSKALGLAAPALEVEVIGGGMDANTAELAEVVDDRAERIFSVIRTYGFGVWVLLALILWRVW